MKKHFLILIGLTIFSLAEFSRDDNGIVSDTKTQLQWQDNYNDNGDEIKITTWQEAIVYCSVCTLGNYDDWRLPNKNELFSITDFNQYIPGINPEFQHTNPSLYWTSTTRASEEIHAWVINFINGSIHIRNKATDTEISIRCVRNISQ